MCCSNVPTVHGCSTHCKLFVLCVCVQLYHSLFRITCSIIIIHFSKLYHCSLTSVFITVLLYCLSLISVLRKYYIQLYMPTPTQVIEI